MNEARFTNSHILMTETFQSIGVQLAQINQETREFSKTIGFAFKHSGVMEMQQQLQEILGDPGIRAAQESLKQMMGQISIDTTEMVNLQDSVRTSLGGVVEQFDTIDLNVAAIKAQLITFLDHIEWDALKDSVEEEKCSQFNEEAKRLRGLLSSEYQNLNSLVIQLQIFFENLNKKSPLLFLVLTLFVWKPLTDSLSDVIRDGSRAIITQMQHATIEDKIIRTKTVRDEAATALSGVEPLFLDAIRVVLKTELALHKHATRKSKVVITLALGQKVRFIQSHGDWTQIESYDAASNIHYSGWVYTRYLAKVEI